MVSAYNDSLLCSYNVHYIKICFTHEDRSTAVGPADGLKFTNEVVKTLNHMHFIFSPILDYSLLNFSLLFVCVCVRVCDFCSEEGKSSPLVDGWKWSSACQQGIVDICKGQQTFKPHPSLIVSSFSAFVSLFPFV